MATRRGSPDRHFAAVGQNNKNVNVGFKHIFCLVMIWFGYYCTKTKENGIQAYRHCEFIDIEKVEGNSKQKLPFFWEILNYVPNTVIQN